ncbi:MULTISPECIES: SDR family NAD(P)-dependent oxidoreductase [Paraburkholderia]|nr:MULTISPECIES: SDR family NAD(P)-dependent oxidoreductase [Paraburkholderia]
MMTEFKAKSAVIIGGETGIGRASAEALAKSGMSVTIAGIIAAKGHETAEAINARGGDAIFVHLDVRDSKKVTEVVQQGRAEGHDILVYSAGVFDNLAGCTDTSEELWNQLMDINLKGCFLANKAALEIMVKRGWGRIVNIGSIASFNASADGFPYTVSKHGMVGLTKHIARRYGKDGITANCVCPGIIETDIVSNTKNIIGDCAPALSQDIMNGDGWKKWVPVGRQGTVGEVADLVAYLAGGSAGYITGQSLVIDGGWLTA